MDDDGVVQCREEKGRDDQFVTFMSVVDGGEEYTLYSHGDRPASKHITMNSDGQCTREQVRYIFISKGYYISLNLSLS